MRPSTKSRSKAREVSETRKQIRMALHAARGPYCEIPDCTDLWTDMHEILLRSRMGDPTDTTNILCLCRDHHHQITVNPEWATANGYIRAATAEEHRAKYRPWET